MVDSRQKKNVNIALYCLKLWSFSLCTVSVRKRDFFFEGNFEPVNEAQNRFKMQGSEEERLWLVAKVQEKRFKKKLLGE